MEYIYFLIPQTNSSKAYIGQQNNRQSDSSGYARLEEHARIAYGLWTGPIYGAEELMQQYSLSGINTTILYGPYFGIPQQIIDAFHEDWVPTTEVDDRVDFAELIWIQWWRANHRSDNLTNRKPGGAITWRYKKLDDLEHNLVLQEFFSKIGLTTAQEQEIIKNSIKTEDFELNAWGGFENVEAKICNPEVYYYVRMIAEVIRYSIEIGDPSFFEGLFQNKNKDGKTPFLVSLIASLEAAKGSVGPVNTEALEQEIIALLQNKFITYQKVMEKVLRNKSHQHLDAANRISTMTFSFQNNQIRSKIKQYAKVIINRVQQLVQRGIQVTAAASLYQSIYKYKQGNELTAHVTIKMNFTFPRYMWHCNVSTHGNIQPTWYRQALKLAWPDGQVNPSAVLDIYKKTSYDLFKKLMDEYRSPLSDAIDTIMNTDPTVARQNYYFFQQDGLSYIRPTTYFGTTLYAKMHEAYQDTPLGQWLDAHHHWEAFYRPMAAKWHQEQTSASWGILERTVGNNQYIYQFYPYNGDINIAYRGQKIITYSNEEDLQYY